MQVCRTLNLQITPEPEIAQLKQQLNVAYQRLAQNWVDNPTVRFEIERGKDTLILSQFDKLEESSTFLELKHQVAALLPRVDLPEVLLEIHTRTGFMDEFTHPQEGNPRVADFSISIMISRECNYSMEHRCI